MNRGKRIARAALIAVLVLIAVRFVLRFLDAVL